MLTGGMWWRFTFAGLFNLLEYFCNHGFEGLKEMYKKIVYFHSVLIYRKAVPRIILGSQDLHGSTPYCSVSDP